MTDILGYAPGEALSPTSTGVRATEPYPIGEALSTHLADRRWIEEAMRRLDAFSALPNDWDEGGSLAPLAAAIRTSRAVILALADAGMPRPFLTPSDGGSVTFEWSGSHLMVELDVKSETEACLYFSSGSEGEEWEGDPTNSPTNLDKLLRLIAEGA